MIYIVEIPHQMPPKAWSRKDKEAIIGVVMAVSSQSGDTIYEEATGRELLDMFGYESATEMLEDNDALTGLADLIDANGVDTTYYKGYGDDEYTIEPVDEFEAHIEWNSHDLSYQMVFMSDEEAAEAARDDSQWDRRHQGWTAQQALINELRMNGVEA